MDERPDEVRDRVVRNDNPTDEEIEELRRKSRSDDEVEAARAGIELTRAEMSETVDALQERVDPDRLKEEARERARATFQETSSQILDTIRQNPAIPAAIAGGVIGLFLLGRLLRGGGGGGGRTETVVFDLRTGRIR